jgi:hypothetical protein
MLHLFKTSKHEDDANCSICGISPAEHQCAICKHSMIDKFMGMGFCEPCMIHEKELQAEHAKHEKERIEATYTRASLPQPDSTITVIHEIFNAKIASYDELRKEIDSNPAIENKHFALAEKVESRYLHFKQVIIDAQNTIKDASQEVRAAQTFYNDLAKKLREDERAKIKISDVQYHPPEKPVKSIKVPTVKKYNKSDIKEAASKSGIPENLIYMTCIARKCTPLEAVHILRDVGYKNKGEE